MSFIAALRAARKARMYGDGSAWTEFAPCDQTAQLQGYTDRRGSTYYPPDSDGNSVAPRPLPNNSHGY